MQRDHGVEQRDGAHAGQPAMPAVMPAVKPAVLPRRLLTGASVLGMVVLAALLGSFLLVVQGAVKRGESMRQAAHSQAGVVWRCNALPIAPQRVACRAEADRARGVTTASGIQ